MQARPGPSARSIELSFFFYSVDCLSRVRLKSHARFLPGESLKRPTYRDLEEVYTMGPINPQEF